MNGVVFQNSIRVIHSFISSMPIDMLSTHDYMDLLVMVVFLLLSAYWIFIKSGSWSLKQHYCGDPRMFHECIFQLLC